VELLLPPPFSGFCRSASFLGEFETASDGRSMTLGEEREGGGGGGGGGSGG
jgi:hypothetical protein